MGNAARGLCGPWLCGVSPGDGGPHHTLTAQLASPKKENDWRRRPGFGWRSRRDGDSSPRVASRHHERRAFALSRTDRAEDTLMYTVVRSYFGKGSKELFDMVEKNKADVEKLMRSVKGFGQLRHRPQWGRRIYSDRLQRQAGADESVEKARDWIATNAAGTGVAPHDIGGTKHPRFEKWAVNVALCDSHTLGLAPPRANFIWQLSLPKITPSTTTPPSPSTPCSGPCAT